MGMYTRANESRASKTGQSQTTRTGTHCGKGDAREAVQWRNSSISQAGAQQTIQRQDTTGQTGSNQQTPGPIHKTNNTGLPEQLKSGVENLSGYSMDDVRVHYNSSKPAQLNALAYAQGNEIHLGSGQEKHLPHEAWHVVQQKQGRVQPTMQMPAGVGVNDEAGLEREADVMGARAKGTGEEVQCAVHQTHVAHINNQAKAIQCYAYSAGTTRNVTVTGNSKTKTFEECTYNSVEYNASEAKVKGSKTKSPAAWAGWLTNKKGGRNATQLHVVNMRWGGLGGQDDKNIVPGTPAENSHHLHQAEKKFDECFNSAGTAINNCKYECTVNPKYGTAVDVKAGNVDFGDPSLSVDITDNGVKTNYPVTPGAEGLTFKEGA